MTASMAFSSSSFRSSSVWPTVSIWAMQICPPSTSYSFASRLTISSAETWDTSEVDSNISRPNSFASSASTRPR